MTRQGKTFFDLSLPDQSWHVESPLLGSHNVLNVLASLTALWATGQFYENILERLRDFPGVPGRMQVVTRHNDILTIVDYAHTADALSHVLKTLKALCPERLLLVFGCGGCRDRAKRPRMMSVAQRWADVIWATSDNPRTEAQEQIFADMKAGMTSHHPLVHWISDRYEAIRQAVETAQARDILLIAGKGHENYQEIGTDRRPFDDAMILRQLMDQRFPK
jgi:UDP-N-acetylmuramoyl-L-alanyl-D-glutamate--2,6-diaminopimelate ligase